MQVIDDYERTKGQNLVPLSEFEELLLERLCIAMYTVIVSLQYIQPTDDFDINMATQDKLLMEIIDIRYVSY